MTETFKSVFLMKYHKTFFSVS
jgi:hypothetical protein